MQALQPEAKITPSKKAPVLELTFSHFGIKKPPDFMPIIENILDGEIIVIPKKISKIPATFFKTGITLEFINKEPFEKVPPKSPANPPKIIKIIENPIINNNVLLNRENLCEEFPFNNPILPIIIGKVHGKKKLAMPVKNTAIIENSIILIC